MRKLSWETNYEIRPDDTLPDASCKLFLEDLLSAARDQLHRRRTASASSTQSNASLNQDHPPRSSTPKSDKEENFNDDMRYMQ